MPADETSSLEDLFNQAASGQTTPEPAESAPAAPATPAASPAPVGEAPAGGPPATAAQARRDRLVAILREERPGLVADDADDDSFLGEIDALAAAAGQIREHQAFADIGRKYLPHLDKIEKLLAEQAGTAPPTAQPASPEATKLPPVETGPADPWTGKPEFNRQWLRYCVQDGKGRFQPADEVKTDPRFIAIASKVNAFFDWRREVGEYIVDDLPTYLDRREKAFLEKVEKRVTEIQQAGLTQREVQHHILADIDQDKDKYFILDQNGNVRRGPNGEELRTELGNAVNHYATAYKKAGWTDPLLIWNTAKAVATAEYWENQVRREHAEAGKKAEAEKAAAAAQQPAAPPEEPAETVPQKNKRLKESFVARSRRAAGRGGDDDDDDDDDYTPGRGNGRAAVGAGRGNARVSLEQMFSEESARGAHG